MLGAILEAVREGDVFWDVGANIGQHSFAVKNTRPDVSVVSFEPTPLTILRGFGQALRNPSLRLIIFENIREGGAADILRQAGFEIRPLTETEACASRPA